MFQSLLNTPSFLDISQGIPRYPRLANTSQIYQTLQDISRLEQNCYSCSCCLPNQSEIFLKSSHSYKTFHVFHLEKGAKKVLFCELAVHLGVGGFSRRTQWFTSLFWFLPKYRYFLISLPFAARDQIMSIVIYK